MQKQNKGTYLFVFYVKLDLTALFAVILNLTIDQELDRGIKHRT